MISVPKVLSIYPPKRPSIFAESIRDLAWNEPKFLEEGISYEIPAPVALLFYTALCIALRL